jgi:chromosome segregation ATPase
VKRKRLTISQRIRALAAEGLESVDGEGTDKVSRLEALKTELAALQAKLETERRRKAAYMRAKRRAQTKSRTLSDEVASRRRAVETRRSKLQVMPDDSPGREKAVHSLRLAERALAKYELVECLLS